MQVLVACPSIWGKVGQINAQATIPVSRYRNASWDFLETIKIKKVTTVYFEVK